MEPNKNQQNNYSSKPPTNSAKEIIVSLVMMIMAFILTALLIYFSTKGSDLEGGMIALGILIVVFLPLFFGGLVYFIISLERYFKNKNMHDDIQSVTGPHKKDVVITFSYFLVLLSVIVWVVLLFFILTPK